MVYVGLSFGCVGMVVAAVFYFLARKSMVLTVSTCGPCERAWAHAERMPRLFFAGASVVTMVVTLIAWKLGVDRLVLLFCIGLGVIVLGTFALHAKGRAHRVWAKTMDTSSGILLGVHPNVVGLTQPPATSTSADR
jgi:hypothetical protein